MADPLKQGNEDRSSILPSNSPAGLGFFGSPYSVADSLLTPAQVGVHKGDEMGAVIDSVKGMGFYIDQIGFGESSNSFTKGMPLKPLGINYFMNTGQQCSNGADMYQYYEGIPKGDALGKRVQTAMKEMGLPALRGLAPGMLEDAFGALNPSPLLNAMLGTGYPQCKLVTNMVGDAYGHIADPVTGENWIETPETATRGSDNMMYQSRWVQDTDSNGNAISLDREKWAAEPKSYNPDGTKKVEISGFTDMLTRPSTVALVGIVLVVAFGLLRSKK
jgi:hypothetical protein